LEIIDGEMMTTRFETATRSARMPIEAGDTFELSGLSISVLSVGDRGPTMVEFVFDRDLYDPTLNFMAVRAGQLRRFAPPPEGARLNLPSLR
jgi:hypothetical protein